jgi:hypothetical protein
VTNRPNLREFSHGGRRSGSENGILLSAGDSPLSGGFRSPVAAENSQGEENARVLTRGRSVTGMRAITSALFSWLACRFRSRAEMELEVVALRRQLAVPRRQRPGRIRLSPVDRLLWVWLYRLWPHCLNVIVLVKPGTVLQ